MKSILFILLSAFIPVISIPQKDSASILQVKKPPLIVYNSYPLVVPPSFKTRPTPDTNKHIIRICAPGRRELIAQPLYIIFFHDKAIFRSDTAKTNAISALNPQDIDKINILKDSTAVARYGSAAKNGVILVTLKKDTFTGSYPKFKTDTVKAKRIRN